MSFNHDQGILGELCFYSSITLSCYINIADDQITLIPSLCPRSVEPLPERRCYGLRAFEKLVLCSVAPTRTLDLDQWQGYTSSYGCSDQGTVSSFSSPPQPQFGCSVVLKTSSISGALVVEMLRIALSFRLHHYIDM